MDEKKQIEEMAKALYDIVNARRGKMSMLDLATDLYNAGYRKQSEGEWKIKVGPLLNDKKISCSICGYKEYRGPAWEKSWGLYPYCPSCGAKMKGGA